MAEVIKKAYLYKNKKPFPEYTGNGFFLAIASHTFFTPYCNLKE
jgi:hypothetical protein